MLYSMSFNAKSLTYGWSVSTYLACGTDLTLESNEPIFLRKLKSEYSGGNSLRHERPLARPRKQYGGNDDDDEPTYVDEESNSTLTKAQYEVMLKPDGNTVPHDEERTALKVHDGSEIGGAGPGSPIVDIPPKKEQVAVIGGSGKRRIAKVFSDEVNNKHGREDRTPAKTEKNFAKRAKKVKLSFDAESADA